MNGGRAHRPGIFRIGCGAAALVLASSACGALDTDFGGGEKDGAAGQGGGQGGGRGGGVVALPVSSAFHVEGRGMRLVRSGEREAVLQFELFNGTRDEVAPEDLGIDAREQLLGLVDPSHGTAYAPIGTGGADALVGSGDAIGPGGSGTVTAVFSAPPKETTEMLVAVSGLLPARVKVQPQGADGLKDDAVLHARRAERRVEPLVCKTGKAGPQATVGFRLSSDVLFAFGSATLLPDAQSALEGIAEQLKEVGGNLAVEGHTDAIGDEPSNQRLSQQRAAAVVAALRGRLDGAVAYRADGAGETRPIAPNARPGGGDNPDGRAQNRRVELQLTLAPSASASAAPAPNGGTGLADAGLRWRVDRVERLAGHVLAQVKVSNPTARALPLDFENHYSPEDAPTPGRVTASDQGTRLRYEPCRFLAPTYYDFIGNLGQNFTPKDAGSVPPGAEVILWSLLAAPPQQTGSMDVQVTGFPQPQPAEIATG
ncbi:OmpA family protein [Actinomadura rubrisoli]|uniref:OmpA family protein n=1 Tax=Actinomadura rubrisoli TaxID=2530368 RepID=A0A4R5BL15_9ACTN|nr:OmpA family protein [Actinomadura rubrisoli]TDD85936.1 OmpA family protein [Actinomadura rubrisoli]